MFVQAQWVFERGIHTPVGRAFVPKSPTESGSQGFACCWTKGCGCVSSGNCQNDGVLLVSPRAKQRGGSSKKDGPSASRFLTRVLPLSELQASLAGSSAELILGCVGVCRERKVQWIRVLQMSFHEFNVCARVGSLRLLAPGFWTA